MKKHSPRDLKRLVKNHEATIASLNSSLRTVTKLHTYHRPLTITAPPRSRSGEATLIAMLSDIHYGLIIRPESVNGLNKYNPDIADRRVCEFFTKVVRLLEKEKQDVAIPHILLHLGGDMIEGCLHDESPHQIAMQPLAQVARVMSLIAQGIEYLLPHATLTVVCSAGNHSRLSEKTYSHTEWANSETLMYTILAQRYPQASWQIAESKMTYAQVYGRTIRFTHGDTIRYGGGVGGIQVPLHKALYRQDANIKADLTLLAHFHTLTVGKNFVVNGSVCGITPYAISRGYEYERPQQAAMVMNKDKGITSYQPVLFSV